MTLVHGPGLGNVPRAMARQKGTNNDRVVYPRSRRDGGRRREAVRSGGKGPPFGILVIVDLQAKMTEKGVEFANACRIYEVCNPKRAKQVLEKDMNVSTIMPCRITVYEDGGKVKVATLLPTQVLGMVTSMDLGNVAQEVECEILAMVDEAAST